MSLSCTPSGWYASEVSRGRKLMTSQMIWPTLQVISVLAAPFPGVATARCIMVSAETTHLTWFAACARKMSTSSYCMFDAVAMALRMPCCKAAAAACMVLVSSMASSLDLQDPVLKLHFLCCFNTCAKPAHQTRISEVTAAARQHGVHAFWMQWHGMGHACTHANLGLCDSALNIWTIVSSTKPVTAHS